MSASYNEYGGTNLMLIFEVIAIAIGVFAIPELIVSLVNKKKDKKKHTEKVQDMHFRRINKMESE